MARRLDITFDQGSNVSISVVAKYANASVRDLTGHTAASMFRKHLDSNTSYSFTANVTNATAGEITLSMNAVASANVVAGRYYYDVEINETSSNTTTRVQEGICTVFGEATK